jgi:predicted nucleotidyltransferase
MSEAVYLFGSSASGRMHAESDLDLAVVPRHPQIVSRKLDILVDLARIGFCDVDLVFLNFEMHPIYEATCACSPNQVEFNNLICATRGGF